MKNAITRGVESLTRHFQLTQGLLKPTLEDTIVPVAQIARCLEAAPISDWTQLVGAGTVNFFVPGVGSVNVLRPGTYHIYLSFSWNSTAADTLLVNTRLTNLAGTNVRYELGTWDINGANNLAGIFSVDYEVKIPDDSLVNITMSAQAATTRTTAGILVQPV